MAAPERLTIHEAQQQLAQREISSVELTRSCLERIHRVEDRVKAFVTVTEDLALQQAEEADRRIGAGEGGPLIGIPMQIKDVMCTRGIRTTCSSRMLENYVPVYDATVVEKLLHQGAVLLGKGNMDEFAMGSSTENSAFFPTRNPWDLDRCAGRQQRRGCRFRGGWRSRIFSGLGHRWQCPPARPPLCGVVGLKPTYGLVSRYGLIAYASSLDQDRTGDSRCYRLRHRIKRHHRPRPQGRNLPPPGEEGLHGWDGRRLLFVPPDKWRLPFVPPSQGGTTGGSLPPGRPR